MARHRDVVMRLGGIESAAFEELCCQLLPRVSLEYEGLEPSTNRDGKTTKGVADAFKRLSDGSYILMACTTQQASVRGKVIGDLEKIASAGIRVSKAVVCINSQLRVEDESDYRDFASRHLWGLDVFSLHRLADSLLPHPDLLGEYLGYADLPPSTTTPGGFFVGNQLRRVREELSLRTSHMVKQLGLASERSYLDIETDAAECNPHMLSELHDVFGVCPNWLTDEEDPKFEVKYLDWVADLSGSLESIRALDPLKVYVTLQADRPWRLRNRLRDLSWWVQSFRKDRSYLPDYSCPLHVGLCAQVGDYRYYTYEMSIALDLWNLKRPRLVRTFYQFLHDLIYESEFEVVGQLLPLWELDSALYTGRAHPQLVFAQGEHRIGIEWPYQVIDLAGSRLSMKKGARMYGRWFPKTQKTFAGALSEQES